MFIGVIRITVNINNKVSSLKDKRRVIKGLKDKLRRSFNVSVNEIGLHQDYYRSEFGISCVSKDRKGADSMLERIEKYFEETLSVSIEGIEREII